MVPVKPRIDTRIARTAAVDDGDVSSPRTFENPIIDCDGDSLKERGRSRGKIGVRNGESAVAAAADDDDSKGGKDLEKT
jgi:hypothetical protein